MNIRSCQRGYSLAEALVAVAIVGLITMVSVPAFMTMYRNNQMKISARAFAGDARWARQLAVTSRQPVKITFGTGSSSITYQIFEQTGGAWNAAPSRTGTLEKNTYLASTTFDDIGDEQDIADDADSRPDIVFKNNGSLWRSEATNEVVIATIYDDLPRANYTIEFRTTGSLTIQ